MQQAIQPTNAGDKHLGYLDSARGIAAMMVMYYHYLGWMYEKTLPAMLASIVFNGSDAVSFFFVLSGFVLSYKYVVLNGRLDIKKFFISRWFRLWPAFFVTLVPNALYFMQDYISPKELQDTFINNYHKFWEEALLFRGFNNFYPPGWTLTFELTLSLLVPFLIIIAKKNRAYMPWLILAYLVVKEVFLIHFILGVTLSAYYTWLVSPDFKQSWWYRYRYFVLPAAIALFSIRHITHISPLGPTYNDVANYLNINLFHYTGLASFIFLAAILRSPKAQRFLEHRLLVYIGKISFSIYLVHWIVVSFQFHYWKQIIAFFGNESLAFTCMLVPFTATCLLLATGMYYGVELPFIRIGKRLTGRLKPGPMVE